MQAYNAITDTQRREIDLIRSQECAHYDLLEEKDRSTCRSGCLSFDYGQSRAQAVLKLAS
jgi:hypothetical protein